MDRWLQFQRIWLREKTTALCCVQPLRRDCLYAELLARVLSLSRRAVRTTRLYIGIPEYLPLPTTSARASNQRLDRSDRGCVKLAALLIFTGRIERSKATGAIVETQNCRRLPPCSPNQSVFTMSGSDEASRCFR